MTGIIITKVENKSTTYTIKEEHTLKMIGYLKHNIAAGEYSFCASFDAVVTTKQMTEILNHMNEINKGGM